MSRKNGSAAIGENSPNLPVVVGIDGSKAAVKAAIWAADEAVRDDATLLLVHVVDTSHAEDGALDAARVMLADAWEAVAATGKSVKVDSDILHGAPIKQLAAASRKARLLCLGRSGEHSSGPTKRGATAGRVARIASTTVVLVRHRDEPSPFHQWIIAVLDKQPDSADVLRSAIDEARIRQAPVLALTSWSTTRGRRGKKVSDVQRTLDRYLRRASDDDVQVCAIPMPDDLLAFLRECVSIDQLVVVGANHTALMDALTSPRAAKILRKSNVSLMFVRATRPVAEGAGG